MTLSIPIFIIMAAIMGPIFLFLPRPATEVKKNSHGNGRIKIIWEILDNIFLIFLSNIF